LASASVNDGQQLLSRVPSASTSAALAAYVAHLSLPDRRPLAAALADHAKQFCGRIADPNGVTKERK